MLIKRLMTALILIPLVLAIIFYFPPPAFCVFTAIVSLYGAFEWSHLMGLTKPLARFIYVFGMAMTFFIALYLSLLPILCLAFMGWLCVCYLIIRYPSPHYWQRSLFLRGLMGIFVLLPCWMSINFIRNENQDTGLYSLLFLLVLIWGADSFAYFFGKKWGKTKLLPAVSPGKSWQGLMGALLFSILFTLATLWWIEMPLRVWPWVILLSLIVVIFSVVGDLFESMLKRHVGIKDSGQIFPGHGGLLDRIDSLTAAAPIFTLGAILLGSWMG